MLLFVTIVSNYLSTQLPTQMRVNDANHALAVENQLARLAASLADAARGSVMGGVLTQPVSLGSAGAPPMAAPDGSTLGPGTPSSRLTVSYRVAGPETYSPPGGWPAGGNLARSGCSENPAGSPNPTTVNCKGSADLTQNFTNGSHFISVTGNSNLHLNFTTNYSTIAVAAAGGAGNTVTLVGNHDVLYLNATGGATVRLTVVGSFDTIAVNGQGGANVFLELVGDSDSVSWSANGASSHFVEQAWGSHDSTTDSNSNARVFYTGFDASNPSSSVCPYDNVSGSDTVAGSGGTVTYNTSGYSGSSSSGGWSQSWQVTSGLRCPFFAALRLSQTNTAGLGADFVVHLRNTYSPPADIAYDEGAVVYAQANGQPLMLDAPPINLTNGTLTIRVAQFAGTLASESGTGTTLLTARLLSVMSLGLPASAYSLLPGGSVVVTVTTPFAAAWMAYFAASSSFAGLASCAPASVCTSPYAFGGAVGTVTLSVPATALVLQVATYALSAR